jgi:hypothetical protein
MASTTTPVSTSASAQVLIPTPAAARVHDSPHNLLSAHGAALNVFFGARPTPHARNTALIAHIAPLPLDDVEAGPLLLPYASAFDLPFYESLLDVEPDTLAKHLFKFGLRMSFLRSHFVSATDLAPAVFPLFWLLGALILLNTPRARRVAVKQVRSQVRDAHAFTPDRRAQVGPPLLRGVFGPLRRLSRRNGRHHACHQVHMIVLEGAGLSEPCSHRTLLLFSSRVLSHAVLLSHALFCISSHSLSIACPYIAVFTSASEVERAADK